MPWLYTGPMENRPDLVGQLELRHRLLGNPADVLRSVRDPFRVSALLRREGLAHAAVRTDDNGLPRDGSWLVKPLASGGGRLIEFVGALRRPNEEPCYYQRFVDGPSISALFVADRTSARLVGVTRQLHGGTAGRFAYRGNVGPIEISKALLERLSRLGKVLLEGFGLIGLFGVDCILRDGEPYVVELNPRYTASVEVLELATGRSLLREHLDVCGAPQNEFDLDACPRPHLRPDRVIGKEVLYARRDVVVPELPLTEYSSDRPFDVPELADIPWPGTSFARGEPIMTVLAEGCDEDDCLGRLRDRVGRWYAFLDALADQHRAASPQA